jgi:hypothetical protein
MTKPGATVEVNNTWDRHEALQPDYRLYRCFALRSDSPDTICGEGLEMIGD